MPNRAANASPRTYNRAPLPVSDPGPNRGDWRSGGVINCARQSRPMPVMSRLRSPAKEARIRPARHGAQHDP